MAENLRRRPYGKYVLERKAEPGFAGMMATREIGWFLVRNAWGQGYATEAAQALLRHAFDELQWPEVVAMTATINIETARLRMRQWTNADIEPFADMNADPQVMEYFLSTTPRERSYELVKILRDDIEKNRYGWFVLERKDTPGFAGMMAIDDVRYEVPYHPRREIGWRLPVSMWGHGYATEAANGLLQYAFETLRWPHIIAMTVHSNARSRRVMERIGMTYDRNDDFEHPRIPNTHPLHPSVLYRKSAPWANDCPECGSTDIVRIAYGPPTVETQLAAERGEVALGGCVIEAAQPERVCRTCGQRF